VARKTHQVDVPFVDVDLDVARRLRSVAMEEDFVFSADAADFDEVLHDADLIVHRHDGDEDRVGPDRGLELFEIEKPVFLDVKVGDFKPFRLEMAHRVENRLVFGLHRNEVTALFLVEVRNPLEGEIVGLGRARRPDDFARIGADQRRDVAAGLFHGLFGFPAVGMAVGRGIAETLVEVRHHFVHHARIHRGRGGVVQVHGLSHVYRSSLGGDSVSGRCTISNGRGQNKSVAAPNRNVGRNVRLLAGGMSASVTRERNSDVTRLRSSQRWCVRQAAPPLQVSPP